MFGWCFPSLWSGGNQAQLAKKKEMQKKAIAMMDEQVEDVIGQPNARYFA